MFTRASFGAHILSGPGRLLAWMIVLAWVVASAMTWVLADGARSQPVEDCPPGFERNDDTGECEQQGTQAPIDIGLPPAPFTIPPDIDNLPVLTPEPTATFQLPPPPPVNETIPPDFEILPTSTPDIGEPPIAQPIEIEITKWECPPGVDPFADWSILVGECGSPASMPFTFRHGTSDVADSSQVATGFIEWVDLPAGTHSIREDIPPGYGVPAVWCGSYSPGEMDAFRIRMPLEGIDTIVSDVAAGQHLACDWFNFRLANEIVLSKFTCPPGTEFGDAIEPHLLECAEDGEGGQAFTLTDASGVASPATTGTDGTVSWVGVPDGPFSIQETVPEDAPEPGVWCGAFPLDVFPYPETLPLDRVEVTDGRWEGAFESGPDRTICYVLNVAPGGSALLPIEGTNLVLIYAYTCPADISRDLSTRDMRGACDPAIAADVALTSGDLRLDQRTGVDGTARWDTVPVGPWSLRSAWPAGTAPLRVSCGYTAWPDSAVIDGAVPPPAAATDFGRPVGPTVVSGAFDATGFTLDCAVLFIVTGEAKASTLTVHAYTCAVAPPGFRTLDEWQLACPDPDVSLGFTLETASGRHAIDTDGGGTARWEDVPNGPLALTATPRPGDAEPVVWCQFEAGEVGEGLTVVPPMSVPVMGGTIAGEIMLPGTDYVCHWFSIPDDTPDDLSTVLVEKFVCPDFLAPDSDYERLLRIECAEPGSGYTFTLDHAGGTTTETTIRGAAIWHGVPEGPFTLTETLVPPGEHEPAWYCSREHLDPADPGSIVREPVVRASAPGGILTTSIDHPQTTFVCEVYNFPSSDRTVTVHKWTCPPGADPLGDEAAACSATSDPVAFTLTGPAGSITRTTIGGTATWHAVEPGELTLDEDIPPGYGEPVVWCALDAVPHEGGSYIVDPHPVRSVDGAVTEPVDFREFTWICHFFDVSEGDAAITINKWTCPAGYDVERLGADPTVDCTEPVDGVEFTIGEGGPSLVTGDTFPGAVRFDGLAPGTYVIEETVPDTVESVFVWDCVDTDIPAVHPRPLRLGPYLDVTVAGGDDVTCEWFNVLTVDATGSLTVEKHTCRTETFTTEVECEIDERGAEFELFDLPEDVSLGVGTTDATGRYTWTGLTKNAYRLAERGFEPCYVMTDSSDPDGHPFVSTGVETIVRVYNCSPPGGPGTPPGEPGKPPTDWPNTGVPAAGQGSPISQVTASPAATPDVGTTATPYFPVRCLESVLATPVTGATPAAVATPAGSEVCLRGAVPTHIGIDVAGVDASIEVVEIVDGVMQVPTGPNVVAWYKETGRLGEPTNMVLAGHLNWWNIPEGVFSHIHELEEGDRIEVVGKDGSVHVYEVQWVRQVDASEPLGADTVGPTDEPSLTLITCGGEWDSAAAEYLARTVVRAVLIDATGAGVDPKPLFLSDDNSRVGIMPTVRFHAGLLQGRVMFTIVDGDAE